MTTNRFIRLGTNEAGTPVLLIIVAAFWFTCWYVARQTAFGNHLHAVGEDRAAARLAGVRTARVSMASYIICAVIADLGATLLLTTITAAVIGGVSLFGGQGSVLGVLGGALVLGFLKQFFDTVQVNAYYQLLIQGLIILALLGIYRVKVRT